MRSHWLPTLALCALAGGAAAQSRRPPTRRPRRRSRPSPSHRPARRCLARAWRRSARSATSRPAPTRWRAPSCGCRHIEVPQRSPSTCTTVTCTPLSWSTAAVDTRAPPPPSACWPWTRRCSPAPSSRPSSGGPPICSIAVAAGAGMAGVKAIAPIGSEPVTLEIARRHRRGQHPRREARRRAASAPRDDYRRRPAHRGCQQRSLRYRQAPKRGAVAVTSPKSERIPMNQTRLHEDHRSGHRRHGGGRAACGGPTRAERSASCGFHWLRSPRTSTPAGRRGDARRGGRRAL